jgi:regulator of protease activity HflC (stomatin/prohibitin superfamily)
MKSDEEMLANEVDEDGDDDNDKFHDPAASPTTGAAAAPAATPTRGNHHRWRSAATTVSESCTPMVACSVLVIILIAVIIILSCSLRRLGSTQYGVRYNVHNKHLDEAARTGGLHIGPPGFRFIKFPSTQVTVDLPDDTCLSQDGLRVRFSVTFQYQMKADWLAPAIAKYRDYAEWSSVVEAAGNSAVQHACSLYTISNFQNKRGEIQTSMENLLRLKLEGKAGGDGSDGVYAKSISLQLRNVDLPEAYQAAIADKQAATEDIVLAQNQRTQEVTKAQTTLLAAREEIKIINNTAINEADIILTEARIKAQEITYALETEALAIVVAKTSLNLTSDGVLAYLSNRLYESVDNLRVTAGEPARLSRKENL